MLSESIFIFFEPGSNTLTDTDKAKIDEGALQMKQNANLKAFAIGYSERGPLFLAMQRAESIRGYLINQNGIDPGRIDMDEKKGGDVGGVLRLVSQV